MGKKKKAATSPGGASSTEATAATNLGETKINRSAEIRAYLKAHPNAMPQLVSDNLTKKLGVTITPGNVSTTKYQMNKAGALSSESSRGRRAGGSLTQQQRGRASAGSTEVDFDSLLAAKELADKLGSVEQAQRALEALAKLR